MKRLFPISLLLCVVLIFTACGFNQLFSSTPCEHVFGGWIVERPATCKEDGLRTRTCVYCSYIEQIRIDKFNTHTEVIDPAILATCERTGLSEGKHCSVCNKVLVSQQETPIVAHTYDDEHDESCNVCNHIRDTQCVHNETEIMEGRAATCTKIGLTAGSKCKTCGEILVNQTVLPVIDHSAGGWIVDKEATKAEDGRKHTECTICGQLIKEEIIPATGSVGLEFTLNEDGKSYRVSGIGTCRDNDMVIPARHDDLPVTTIGERAFYNCDSLTGATIPDSVTTIGDYAFGDCIWLWGVTIGNSVTTIGDYAFSGCIITSITIPDSVTTIGDSAFRQSFLRSVTIPDSVTTIGDYVFYDCSLEVVTIPDSVTTIGNYAFSACDILTSVTIGNSVTTIGDYAFNECSRLTSVTIPDSVTTIGEGAFLSCIWLRGVTIPDSVTTIGNRAFLSCDSLTSITIPDSVTTIGDSAFLNCDSLTSITIPDSVTTIGEHAFDNCDSLNGIWVDKDNPAYSNDEYGVLFSKDKTVLCQVPGALAGAYIIPDSITTIGEYMFCNCDSLTSITIPDSVTTIGEGAFLHCDSLNGIWVDKDNPAYSNDEYGVLFSKDKTVLCQVPGALAGAYIIPDSVTTIGDDAFSFCDSLTSVTIGNSVTTIGSSAFSNCTSLTSVTIGDSVTTIGDSAFYSCRGLTSVTIPDSVTTIGSSPFSHCASLTSVTIGNSVKAIGYNAFYFCNNLTSVTIGNSVTVISSSAFDFCLKLTDITFKGTMEQWNNIDFGDYWKHSIPAKKVTCSNGSVSLK